MKKLLVVLVMMLMLVVKVFADADTAKYLYTEAHMKIDEPVFFDIIHSRNFRDEENTVMYIVMQKPFDLPWCLSLDGGPMVHIQGYQKWNPQFARLEKDEKIILGAFIVPEINLNWGLGSVWCNVRTRDELKLKWNGEFDTNLFLAQMRAWHRLFSFDAAYTTFDLGKLGGIRYPGTDSELRLRLGVNFQQSLEIGLQTTWAYYQSEIWESELRPNGGVYARINLLPFWLEISWERMLVKEKDRRMGKINPEFDQDRVLIGVGFSQDPNARRFLK
ncbi:MAG: hypothetical protein PHW01_04750 [Patescibacteria group bacterium]|nr:hypothetical protein [Patescibacteria group bacterium]